MHAAQVHSSDVREPISLHQTLYRKTKTAKQQNLMAPLSTNVATKLLTQFSPVDLFEIELVFMKREKVLFFVQKPTLGPLFMPSRQCAESIPTHGTDLLFSDLHMLWI